jgi:tRNA threonylcarbamoyladenosine biosynthesis protein TsaB
MGWVLGIDTSLSSCSAALYNTETSASFIKSVEVTRGYAEILLPMHEDLMGQASISYDDVHSICVTRGPGGFTGLRVGLSTARALGLALDIPVLGVSSFDAFAATFMATHDIKTDQNFLTIFESRRDEIYVAGYNGSFKQVIPEQSVLTDIFTVKNERYWENETLYVAGDGAARFMAEAGCPAKTFEYKIDPLHINPLSMVQHFVDALPKEGGYAASVNTDPLYLRDADVSVSKTPAKTLAGA